MPGPVAVVQVNDGQTRRLAGVFPLRSARELPRSRRRGDQAAHPGKPEQRAAQYAMRHGKRPDDDPGEMAVALEDQWQGPKAAQRVHRGQPRLHQAMSLWCDPSCE